jgi:hypothetical protein
MSIKLINNTPRDADSMEVRLKGSGATTVGLFDGKGNALLTKRIVLSGSSQVEAKSLLRLTLGTKAGQIQVVPVLIHQTSPSQTVTFGGQDPGAATAERFRAMKLNKNSISKIQTAARLSAESIAKTGTIRGKFGGK